MRALLLLVLVFSLTLDTQSRIAYLWPAAPLAVDDEEVDRPHLEVFLPPRGKANGSAAIICPGGGYTNLTYNAEGIAAAHWLNSLGISAFILTYRLGPRYHYPAQQEDVLRAIRFVRFHAEEYGIAPGRIGVIGFSAGGHLASLAALHYGEEMRNPADPVDFVTSRPDFFIAGCPVVTMLPPFAHEGSVASLLGGNPPMKLRYALSNDLHIRPNTPPAFLFQNKDDALVPVQNSIRFYAALKKAGIPVELHLYDRGGHTAGIMQDTPQGSEWTREAKRWFAEQGLLKDHNK